MSRFPRTGGFAVGRDGVVRDYDEWYHSVFRDDAADDRLRPKSDTVSDDTMSPDDFANADTPRAWSAVPYPEDWKPPRQWGSVVKVAAAAAASAFGAVAAVAVLWNPPGASSPTPPSTVTAAPPAPITLPPPPAVTLPPPPASTVTLPPPPAVAPPDLTPAPAVIPTMSGHYHESDTNLTTGIVTPNEFEFTPCGEGCADAVIGGSGVPQRARLHGDQWSMDLDANVNCPDGSHMPNAATTHLAWDANSLTGTARFTYKYSACGNAAGFTFTNTIQFRRSIH